MRIAIFVPDLSTNCLGRAYVLARILQRKHEVELYGPVFGEDIWKPLANEKDITITAIKGDRRLKGFLKHIWFYMGIKSDLIITNKPLITSFGIGLIIKAIKRTPLILDIDDWEIGFLKGGLKEKSKGLVSSIKADKANLVYKALFNLATVCLDKLTFMADRKITSCRFLYEKYGGIIIPHARDKDILSPDIYSKNKIRQFYKISCNTKIVMFLGSPRRYKGVEELIEAIRMINDPLVYLLIIGVDFKDPYCLSLIEYAETKLGNNLLVFGMQPFEKLPALLTMADLISIPQRRNEETRGQVPAKIFDAMAMAKPIVVTDVSDIKEIVDGCGLIIEPGNINQMASAIKYLLDNPIEANAMGQKARERFIVNYCYDAVEGVLEEVINDVIK